MVDFLPRDYVVFLQCYIKKKRATGLLIKSLLLIDATSCLVLTPKICDFITHIYTSI